MVKEDPIFKAKKPAVAVDVILFTVINNEFKVGLVKRDEDPYNGSYALPGRFIRYDEPIEETVKNVLKLKCNLNPDNVFLNQLYAFGQDLNRDTRLRTISIVYYGVINSENIIFSKTSKVEWCDVTNLPQLAFDHKDIINFSINKIRRKSIHDLLLINFMPNEFTLTELQKTHEAIINEEVDKRNFRKKIKELNILKPLKKFKREGAHRPAQIYISKI